MSEADAEEGGEVEDRADEVEMVGVIAVDVGIALEPHIVLLVVIDGTHACPHID